jgi:membrane fusion protein (multidrug efflux system)
MGRIPKKVGSMVEEGAMLSTLSSTGDAFIYFNVSESEPVASPSDRSNSPRVTLTLPDGTAYLHEGRLDSQDVVVDRSTGNYGIRGRFPNPDSILRHGMSVKVTLTSTLPQALVIPQKSSFEVQHRLCVFGLDSSNIVQIVPFEPSARLPNHFVVGKGLSESNRIVLDGILLVREGQKVSPENRDWTQSNPL